MAEKRFLLCPDCAARFSGNPLVGRSGRGVPCFICGGAFAKIPELTANTLALPELAGSGWRSFSVSVRLPRTMQLSEARVRNFFPVGARALKAALNERLLSELERVSGREFDAGAPDVQFIYDFSSEPPVSLVFPSLFVFGRYEKLTRDTSASRWPCSRCDGMGKIKAKSSDLGNQLIACPHCEGHGKMYDSLEAELGLVLVPLAGAKDTAWHSAGREDVDVITRAPGRPFVIELGAARVRRFDLSAAEEQANRSSILRVHDLQFVSPSFVELATASAFDKEYEALVETGRAISDADLAAVLALSGAGISQRTPKRVEHRRADLVRVRRVKAISVECEPSASTRLRLRVRTEAGAYIKELVSGDNGRTQPSLSERLGRPCACVQLDVVKICDSFLQEFLENERQRERKLTDALPAGKTTRLAPAEKRAPAETRAARGAKPKLN